MLIGETSLGKTSLISLFTKGEVDPDITITNGATFIKKKVDYNMGYSRSRKISFFIKNIFSKRNCSFNCL